jgi:tetratricopeptide (TPR) repeat protein/transcriptional regulator with XRE-family HTH domain
MMASVAEPTFAGLLRQLRTSAGMTQEELASAASLSPRAISDLERGINLKARKDTARLLADALGLTGPPRGRFEAAARGLDYASIVGVGMATATRTLPRAIGTFTGRETELRSLVTASAESSRTGGVVAVNAIGGMAGIGKTTFAVHAAHELAPHFPDGQIFLPLHAHTPGREPVDPADALVSLLLTAGVPASQIPPGLEDRSLLWRDRLAGKHILLVLDDAVGHEQIRPLLPGTRDSMVLVTSRRHLTALEDTLSISLDTLAADEAALLLIQLAGRPGLTAADPAVHQITRLCGYLPLAIGMLARQLHHHPAWSARDVATDLETARDRLQLMHAENLSVAAAFDLSYQELTGPAQRLFRRLGLHPGEEVDAYSAAALASASLSEAGRGLESLYDHYLLMEPARGRYRFHDLVREHSRSLVSADAAEDNDAAIDRLAGFYLHTASAADRHLSRRTRPATLPAEPAPTAAPDLSARQDALSWLERERVNLQAVADQAACSGRSGAAVALAAAMHAHLRLNGHWDQARTLHEMAISLSVQAEDSRAEATAHHDLGDLFIASRNYAGATANLGAALGGYRALGDEAGEAAALSDLSAVSYLTGDYSAAAASLGEALAGYRRLGDQRGEADVRTRLGNAQLGMHQYQAAAENLVVALAQYRELGDYAGEAYARTELGAVLQATGSQEEAAEHLNRALGLYRQLGDRRGEANALVDLATVHQSAGHNSLATASLIQALASYEEFGDEHGRAYALSQLGLAQRMAGDIRSAAGSQQQAFEGYRRLGDRFGETEALIQLGEIALEAADLPAARDYLERARALAADVASLTLEARAIEGQAECDRRAGRHSAT